MPDTDQRLGRIENDMTAVKSDLSSIKEAVTEIVRMEERLVNYQDSMRRQWKAIEKLQEQMAALQISTAKDGEKVDFAGRFVWMIIGLIVAGVASQVVGG